MAMNVLVTGGSGYLGQFLLLGLQNTYQVDFTTGKGLDVAFKELRPLHAIINCAAMSKPAACEQQPDLARSINVPRILLDYLEQEQLTTGMQPVLIYLSTDQVYDGRHAYWTEDSPCSPVNVYGQTKLEAEAAIQARWPRSVILRSSIIYGPLPPEPVPGSMPFLQFLDSSLAEGKSTSCFEDEFRCPIYVNDIVAVVRQLLAAPQPVPNILYNMGGPERLSRYDMGIKVAKQRGYDASLVVAASASSIQRSTASPADISMSTERLVNDMHLRLTPFSEALQEIFS